MLLLFFANLIISSTNPVTIFNFTKDADSRQWRVVDDVVMGGRSSGQFQLNEEGNGLFSGDVSLENNGGFSSVRHNFDEKDLTNCKKFVLRIKGDGKKYQFRAKTNQRDYYSYIYTFQTTGNWQIIEIPFDKMMPGFRGRMLDMPNYPGEHLQEIAFLIGNKKKQSFELEIQKIEAE